MTRFLINDLEGRALFVVNATAIFTHPAGEFSDFVLSRRVVSTGMMNGEGNVVFGREVDVVQVAILESDSVFRIGI